MVSFQSWRRLWLLYSQGAPCDKNYNYFFLSELHALFKAHDAILLTNAGESIIFCCKNWRDKEKFMLLIHFYFQKLVHPSQTQARSQTRFPKTKMFFAKMTMGGLQLRRNARLVLLKSNPCSNVKDKRVLQKHKNYCDDSPGDGRYQAVCHDVRGGKERLTIVIFTHFTVLIACCR